ncbi:MAG: hypothetical protein IT379_01570, partial [Deltaproteobacteria bacterium]|nr:hypothetical protein [Deltaproteobacteria bacterium]
MDTSAFRRAWRRGSTRVALAVTGLLGVGLCFVPLFGTLGIEHALAVGLVTNPIAAALGASLGRHEVRSSASSSGGAIIVSAWMQGLALLLPPFAIALANALRVPWCDPPGGLATFILLPGVGVLVASTLGALVGAAWPSRAAPWLAAAIPWVTIAWTFVRFHATPGIFAFDPFYGWFPGTLYDEIVALPIELGSYRLLSILAIAALGLTLIAGHAAGSRWRPRHVVRRPAHALAAVAAWVGVVGGWWAGPSLGHRQSSEDVREALGSTLRGERCDVVVPTELDRREARRLRSDCDFRLAQMERRLGARGPERVTAFFFRSADEKRRLMGAAETNIAKPWRSEVYLVVASAPHPILAHELAHVVAGSFGRGPFRIAGSLGGILPSPGLIEGVAVAAAWEPREGMSPHQWARAMLEAGLAPRPAKIVGTSFLAAAAGRAYTTAGSFVRFLLDSYGPAKLHAAYASGSLEPYGESPEALEQRWLRFVRAVPIDPDDVERARARFSAHAIWDEPCAHELAELRYEAAVLLGARDPLGSARVCREVLERAPWDGAVRAMEVRALALAGRAEMAERAYGALVRDDDVPRAFVAAAREGIADAAWRRGRFDEAATLYGRLRGEPRTESELRLLEVKEVGAASGESAIALRRFLLADVDGNADASVGMYWLRRLDESREDGLAAYLIARQL